MVEVKHITKSFEGRVVLNDISAVFETGKTNLIIGRSGSGKTVLIKNIIGLMRPDSGEILYDGRDLTSMDKHELNMLRREMGMLFQGSALFDSMTVLENVMFPLDMFSNDTYKDRLYTTGAAGFPGCQHIDDIPEKNKDFSKLIEQAKHCAPPLEIERGEIIGGFAHAQVFALADQVVSAVKSGAIRKFVVMAGCDGRAKSRSYYTDFAKALPKDTVILTAGCAKYKYNKLNLGDINGIPRVLDAGQCNDSYSLAVIALKLKEIFELNDINELPIIYNIAWYEQKAVIVLLALLSLGVKNIHLGPTLPAFLSPNVTKLLIENFQISGIDTVEHDMRLFFGE